MAGATDTLDDTGAGTAGGGAEATGAGAGAGAEAAAGAGAGAGEPNWSILLRTSRRRRPLGAACWRRRR